MLPPMVGDDQHGEVSPIHMARKALQQQVDLRFETGANIMNRNQKSFHGEANAVRNSSGRDGHIVACDDLFITAMGMSCFCRFIKLT